MSQLPQEVISCFSLQPDSLQRLSGGMINATYLVSTHNGQQLILQQLGTMFDDTLVEDFDTVTGHLKHQGWDMPTTVRTQAATLSFRDTAGGLWRASTYITHDVTPVSFDRVTLGAIGKLLGELHASLATLAYEPRHHIPHFHQTAYYAATLETALRSITDSKAHERAEEVLAQYRSIPPFEAMNTPQLIHGDPRINNMLFKGNKPFTFIDWDTLMKASVWVDIGDLLRSYIETSLEQKQTVGPDQLRAITDGYASAVEVHMGVDDFYDAALNAAKVIALELAMRFLHDTVVPYFSFDEKRYADRLTFDMERSGLQLKVFEILGSAKLEGVSHV